MTDIIMQCCYTNAVQEIGGKVSSGWQPVAVTSNIPSEAYNTCVSLQNANSTIQSGMVDERGNVLNLYEITGDGTYVYVSRTQYGLLDRLGRPNMFSHAYIFPWKMEGVIDDPNVFLTLERANFADSEESAAAEKSILFRADPFTLERALSVAGMDSKAYLTLIQCVYAQFSEKKAAKPLFINYDGTDEQMQAILYCIYYGLPYFVRKNLSVASTISNTSDSKNIIFSESAGKHECFILPQTGENNVLTPRTERKIARFGFVDYAARKFSKIDIAEYHVQLEKLAQELGDLSASNELILKIAHQLIEGVVLDNLSDEDLDSRISDALRSRSFGSQRMEEYISEMLDEIRRRKLFLSEESEANLADRLASPASERFANAGEEYNIYRFSTLSVEDAAKMLSGMTESVFTRYSVTLAKSKKGLQILDHYYANYALAGKNITWADLNSLLEKTEYMSMSGEGQDSTTSNAWDTSAIFDRTRHDSNRIKTLDFIDKKAWELYYTLLDADFNAIAAYNSLIGLMGKMISGLRLTECEQAAKEEYWERKKFESFSCDALAEYQAMSISSAKCKMFSSFFYVINEYREKGDEAFLKALNHFFVFNAKYLKEANLKEIAMGKAKSEVRKISIKAISLSDWIQVATIAEAEELFAEALSCRTFILDRNYEGLVAAYQKVVQVSSFTRNSSTFLKALSKTLIADCQRADCDQYPVSLDAWLVLGSSQYSNGFRIFDMISPSILDIEDAWVVSHSTLLGKRPYSLFAEDYIQNKGSQSKVVRAWLNELKQSEKRKKAEDRRARGETDGSFFDRGKALFSQFTGEEDSRAKPANGSPQRQGEWFTPRAGAYDASRTPRAGEPKGVSKPDPFETGRLPKVTESQTSTSQSGGNPSSRDLRTQESNNLQSHRAPYDMGSLPHVETPRGSSRPEAFETGRLPKISDARTEAGTGRRDTYAQSGEIPVPHTPERRVEQKGFKQDPSQKRAEHAEEKNSSPKGFLKGLFGRK